MDKVQTQGKSYEELREQGLCVGTDCGAIEVIPYDDGIANGIKVFLNDILVCMVDCYRDPVTDNLPKTVTIPTNHLNLEDDEDNKWGTIEQEIGDYLSDTYGFCVSSFNYRKGEGFFDVFDIEWDVSGEGEPEARLLVYGADPGLDEPQETITLN